MQTKTILRRWARGWVDECAKYATWEHEHHFGDSPVGYSERTLMAHLVRAWPFGGARARYLPLLAEFPTPRRKTLAGREKRGRARIPDLWFASAHLSAGVFVEGKVAFATATGGGFHWQESTKTSIRWAKDKEVLLTPGELARRAEGQLDDAGVGRSTNHPRGVVAIFVVCEIPLEGEDVPRGSEKERGRWWSAFVKAISKDDLPILSGNGPHALVSWSSACWARLHNDTREWNEKLRDEGGRRRREYFYPHAWLLLYEYPSITPRRLSSRER